MAATPPPLNGPRGPVTPPGVWSPIQINSHLHTLKILFYVAGGIQLAISVVLLLAAIGGYTGEMKSSNPAAQPVLLAAVFVTAAVFYGALFALSFSTARNLTLRYGHRLCLAGAGAACCIGALGIALCVYALIVLLKPEVKTAFAPPGSTVVA
ncbi:hypothetical protein [Stenotrophomonas sp. PS02289]|uniref:hypothetical protein n=1 Tax=Stenotrophomonas sp. PS02289 TaxID=2991422 RepID=UPI00249A46D3|nr:hypothetical protein [Stenotrophomonas sp. PS02289]